MNKKYLLTALPGVLIAAGAVLVATAFLEDIQSIAYAGYALLAIGISLAIARLLREGKKRNWSWARIGVNLLFVFGAISVVIPVVFGAFIYRNWWLFVLGWITSGLLMLIALFLGRKMAKERPAKERELDEKALLIRSEASSISIASASLAFVFSCEPLSYGGHRLDDPSRRPVPLCEHSLYCCLSLLQEKERWLI